jgi:phage shock protein A
MSNDEISNQLRAELRDMKDELTYLRQELANVKAKLERMELQERQKARQR